MSARQAAVDEITKLILEKRIGVVHPFRVAVDGRTAAGKTSLADEVATTLRRSGCSVIRLSIDGFHRPRAERYRLSRTSPLGYLDDARDWQAIRSLMLDPLGPDGDRMYQTQIFDLKADVPLNELPLEAPSDAIVIVDGTFLQRGELAGGFDFIIFVDVTAKESLERGVSRDSEMLGGADQARIVFEERYLGAFQIYEERTDVRASADIIVDNSNFEGPKLTFK